MSDPFSLDDLIAEGLAAKAERKRKPAGASAKPKPAAVPTGPRAKSKLEVERKWRPIETFHVMQPTLCHECGRHSHQYGGCFTLEHSGTVSRTRPARPEETPGSVRELELRIIPMCGSCWTEGLVVENLLDVMLGMAEHQQLELFA